MLADVQDRDIRAFARKQRRHSPADAAVRPGNQRDLALQAFRSPVARPPVGLGLERFFLARRSAERRVGKECVSTCIPRGWPNHYKTKKLEKTNTHTVT